MSGCNIHNCVHDWRGNKMFHEQNEGNLFLFFSLYLLLSYSSSSFPISCRNQNKSHYCMTAFTSSGPSPISRSPLLSPKYLQSILLLSWRCPPPYLCWAGQPRTVPGAPLPLSPAWTELGLLWLLLQWGTSAMTLQAQTWRKLVYLCQSVKFA